MKQILPLSIGIDVSKDKVDVAVLFADKTSLSKTFANTEVGICELGNLLKMQKTADTVPCVLESTGDYHLLSALMLTQEGYMVNCINPLITKKYQRSSVRNAKTDAVDALRLAQIGIMEPDMPVFTASKPVLASRKLVSSLAKMQQMKQQLSSHVKQLRQAQSMLGEDLDFSLYDTLLETYDKQIKSLQKQIGKSIPEHISEFTKNTRGVSANQMAILSCMLADKTFTNRDQLVAFIGLDVMPRSSGTWQGKGKISKRGNAYLRKILYQIAWGLKVHNPHFKEYYLRLRIEQKKHYTTCLIAVARKFLRYYYATVLQETYATS